MADWFKFYENDLDETRMQYAIHHLPESCPVWVGILSECCRHKSDTIRWGTSEIEVFGFSKRLGITAAKAQEAVLMLAKIEYITLGDNSIKVLKWAEKQSEYCQKKSKRQNQSGDKNLKKVGTVSGQCRDSVLLEERRGEEIRGDKTAGAAPQQPEFTPRRLSDTPTIAAALKWLQDWKKSGADYTEAETRSAFLALEASGWMWGKNPVTGHRAALERQIQTDRTKANHGNNPKNNQRPDRAAGTLNEGRAALYRGIKSKG